MKKIFFIFIIFSSILKADVKVEAFFLQEKAGTEDIIDFVIKIEGDAEGSSKPFLQSNEDFQILSGPSISTSVQIVNFNMKKSVEYRWKVNPKREGNLSMPQIEIQIGKNIYKTNPATIEVVKGSVLGRNQRQIPSTFDNFFEEPKRGVIKEAEVKIQAVPNKTECFVGEPIVISYNLLTQTSIQNISLAQAPLYDGFWVENIELPERPEGKKVTIDGKDFTLFTIKKDLLFPNSEGIKKINETTFQIQAITQRDFFGFPQVENIIRKTSPINIKVNPIPEAKYPSFKGAVGKFDISIKTDKIEVEEGEAFTLNLKLSGKGNFKNITDLNIPEIPLCKIYSPKIEEKIKPTSDGYEGSKVWEWVVVPEEKQTLKIPQISFTYFDPQKKDYIELKTSSLNVFVKKGKEKPKEEIFVSEGKEIKEISKDIEYIIVDGKNLRKKEENKNFLYYLFIFPLLLNLSLFIIKKLKERKLTEKEKFEAKAYEYFKKAKQYIKLKNEEDFVKNIEKGLKVLVSGNEDLTMDEFKEKIIKFSEVDKNKLMEFLNHLQDFRFNPLFKDKKTLEEIEKEGKIWFQKLRNL